MKILLPALALVGTLAFAQEFKVGAPVTDFRLNNLTGQALNFSSLKGDTTVVIFTSVQCPVSNAYNERMEQLYEDYSAKGVKFVFLNANATESPSSVVRHAHEAGFTFPLYKDTGNAAADKFGATVTPETYVIDGKGILRYRGAIDDSQNPARIHKQSLRQALNAVLAGQNVPVTETRAFGCTIKRIRRSS